MRWITREGKELLIKDMETDHIRAVMRQLKSTDYIQKIYSGGGNSYEDFWLDVEEVDLKSLFEEMRKEITRRVWNDNII